MNLNVKKIGKFEDLLGETLVGVEEDGDTMTFTLDDGRIFQLYHSQDCCESVSIEDISGDLADLVGPVTLAYEDSNYDHPMPADASLYDDSCQWTFYRIGTNKGIVCVRWFGTSNGYYSTGVSFQEITPGKVRW